MNLDPLLKQRYEAEGINPETNAFALIDGKVYLTVAGMELKAMRSGVLAGKQPVQFGPGMDVTTLDGTIVNGPEWATATYQRLVMDQPRDFSSDPVQFDEYAKKRWHYEKPFMFLAKIARACALRHAFPDIFAGVVSYEEMQCELKFADHSVPPGKTKFADQSSSSPQEQKVQPTLAGKNEYIPGKPFIPKGECNLPDSPKAVSDMVAAIFKQGVQS